MVLDVMQYSWGRKCDAWKLRNHEDTLLYKESIVNGHDMFLDSVLETGSYTKLYSYTHLLNGFALHVTSEEVLKVLENAKGVRIFHEDIKMKKLTTHTPEYLGIPSDVWPSLGGAESSGERVVIGMIDTGINPNHPSFSTSSSVQTDRIRRRSTSRKFRGICQTGERFTEAACNEKIVGAQYFSRGAIAAGDFNATRDYSSPFDADGHGSHTASTAAGNSGVPVIANGFNYGFASGMAPGARIAVYKALYTFGGYMSDVVAAVDQAVEDGVDILSLSIGPSSVPPGPSAYLNVLEMELLFATKAGVLVVQAVGNAGPSSSSILSFSPWITSVAASMTDRKYNSSIKLGNGVNFSGTGLAPPTIGERFFPIAAAVDVCNTNTSIVTLENCQHPEPFIPSLVQGKLIICTYTFDFEFESASITAVAETMQKVGAAGFIITMDPDVGSEPVKGTTVTFQIPGIVLNNIQASNALWEYYNSNTVRNRNGRAVTFTAMARILDGRQATYTGNGPIVASYSSRGPDVDNALMQTADVLKPNIMAPGSSIWAAWSPNSEGDHYIKGQNFALVSGTSMATPHIAGVAALIKQKHPRWSPAAITSAMMTTADTADHLGVELRAQQSNQLANATPFDYGSGFVHPSKALNPGLVFDINFQNYVQFLCAVPGVDEESVRRAIGVGCPDKRKTWCSDLNTASVTVSNLVGSRTVHRKVKNVATEKERYMVTIKEPMGVSVRVTPSNFSIRPNISRSLQINLKATEATNAFTFGELLLRGSRKHNVRIPLAVFATSALIT
ncbi:Subtilisin-like protease SBT2.5 [Thalictrum thalictroides]|uniref:Subtilisin-like protease SBT2.5 n=1 Tax=Thalictrum thalictroides TaxID=46969 RepID=A0A7J6V9W8_THATH|nr:Subtilisin-like protease SBT2.5 [Thalictrum thalictroides]